MSVANLWLIKCAFSGLCGSGEKTIITDIMYLRSLDGVVKINRCSYCRKADCKKRMESEVFLGGRMEEMELRYCSPECQEKIERFIQLNREKGPVAVLLILAWVVLFAVLPFVFKAISGNPILIDLGMPVLLAILGIALAVFPVAIAPKLWYKRLGIKYSSLFIRITGVLMLITGINLLLVR